MSFPRVTTLMTTHPPTVESLETRSLLSATLSNGTLEIDGSRRSDTIEIYTGPTISNRIVVIINGVGDSFRSVSVKRIVVNAGQGDDFINTGSLPVNAIRVIKPATLLGGSGNDHITANSLNTTIDGQDGNDNLLAGTGAAFMMGSEGLDSLLGGQGIDTLSGGDDGDTILAGPHGSFITGDAGDDHITGGEGNDSISGGAGNDVISGLGGTDSIQGDNGDDILSISDGDGGVGGFIQGGRGNDFLTGNPTSNLFGNAGEDNFTTPSVSLVKDPSTGDTIRIN
jgi:Ca2+-binding RTX toxin-like protein